MTRSTEERRSPSTAIFPVAEVLEDLRRALVSRFLDERELTLQKQGRVFFQVSAAGHEALQLALARALRPGVDWVFPYYRDRTLALALGVTPEEMLLQAVGSSADPASGGRQMPCHFSSPALHIATTSSPTTSQCLPAVGCAEASRYLNAHGPLAACSATPDEITVTTLGDGACSEGEFWEALNTACTLRLPLLFVVEDNGFAISVPASEQSPGPITALTSGWPGLHRIDVDGTDYFAAREAIAYAVSDTRAGNGPWLIRGRTTRPYSHSAADTQSKYRGPEELAEEAERDPIARLEAALLEMGVITEEGLTALRAEAFATVAAAATAALAAPRPDPAGITEQLTALPPPSAAAPGPRPSRREGAHKGEVMMGEAIRRALGELMEGDERIRLFGEDVADARVELLESVEGKGGVFGTTLGLQRRFGVDRCFNTPLAEANIVGRAVGQALRGLHPAPEIQFFDYVWPAMQQIRSEAATIRWRSNGAFHCPLVLRIPIGGYLTGGAIWHSQCGESIFTHIPGLLVAFPSRAEDAVGLLRTAFSLEDPVLFLEHKHLLRQRYTRDPYPEAGFAVPFGKARLCRPGRDLTIVTYGATVEKSLQAAALLAGEGAEVEVLDLRTLSPWDQEAVAESAARTSRVLVVHEDTLTSGFGAEIAAWVGQHCFTDLDAPVTRLAARDTWVSYEPELERATLPQTEGIAAAARELLGF